MSFGENSPLNEKFICKKILGVGGFGKAFLVENKEDHILSVIKEIDMKEMDQKALEIVKKLPHWHPAILDGKAIRCRMLIPVTFQRCRLI